MVINQRLLFWLILCIFTAKGLYFCFFIPPWEAPDEPDHTSYVAYLYHNKSVPHTGVVPNITKNIAHSLTYQKKYIIPKIQKGTTNFHNNLFDRNAFRLDASQVWGIAGNPPLYYLYLIPFYSISLHFQSYVTLIFLRIGSLLLGVISLIFIYHISKFLFPKSSYIPIITIALTALQPMFTFITAVVNNDAMVIFFFIFLIYLILRFVLLKDNIKLKHLILIGLIAGLSTLTKPQMLIDIFIFLFAFLFIHRMQLRDYIYSFISVLLIPSLWYGIRLITDGMQTFSYPYLHAQKYTLPLWRYPIDFIHTKQPIGIFMSFWGYFGWLDVPMPKWTYILFISIFLLSATGWIIILKNKTTVIPRHIKKTHIFLYSASLLYVLPIFFYDISTFTRAHRFIIQGRYFLPILYIVILWTIQGLYAYKDNLKKLCIIYSLCVFILVHIIMYTSIAKFYYHSYPIIPPLTKIYTGQQ